MSPNCFPNSFATNNTARSGPGSFQGIVDRLQDIKVVLFAFLELRNRAQLQHLKLKELTTVGIP